MYTKEYKLRTATMQKKQGSTKVLGIASLILGILLFLFGGYYLYMNFSAQTYTSSDGFFSVKLSKNVYYFEEKENDTSGRLYLSMKPIDKTDPKGLVIFYEIPLLEGKGGMCVDANGEGAWETGTIAGQTVEKCTVGGYYAGYLKNSIHPAEYYIYNTDGISVEDITTLSGIVETSFQFK